MYAKNPVGFTGNRVFYCLLIMSLIISAPAQASTPRPFYSHNQNPLVMIYGLPAPVSAQIIKPEQTAFHASLNLSNTINRQHVGTEFLHIDIESYRLNLMFDYSLNPDWMLRLQLPVIGHSGGFMDDWIDRYHNLLSLPEGVRPLFPTDQLRIDYQDGTSSSLLFTERQLDLGDISIQTGYQSVHRNDFSVSYWTSLKLPTGDSHKLTGSGSTDLALWTALNQQIDDNSWFYGNLGLLLMGGSDILSDRHRRQAIFGSAGFQFKPWKRIQLKAQIDSHSAFYDSSLRFLGPVIQLTFGGSYMINKDTVIDVAVAEDIQTEASPDVNFILSWHQTF